MLSAFKAAGVDVAKGTDKDPHPFKSVYTIAFTLPKETSQLTLEWRVSNGTEEVINLMLGKGKREETPAEKWDREMGIPDDKKDITPPPLNSVRCTLLVDNTRSWTSILRSYRVHYWPIQKAEKS